MVQWEVTGGSIHGTAGGDGTVDGGGSSWVIVHHGTVKMAKTGLRVLMAKSKADFYNSKITNSKSLFKVVDTLIHHKSSVLQSNASK